MITIKITANSGAELRKDLEDLLGVNGSQRVTVSGQTLVEALASVPEETPEADPAPTAEETKPTRKRRTKAEIEAEKAAEGLSAQGETEHDKGDVSDTAEVAPTPTEEGEAEVAPTPTEVEKEETAPFETSDLDLNTVREAVAELSRSGRKKDAIALLDEFKVKKVGELPTSKYEEFYGRVQSLLNS